jgi:hypothetical protein
MTTNPEDAPNAQCDELTLNVEIGARNSEAALAGGLFV